MTSLLALLICVLVFLALGYFGTLYFERRHLASLAAREATMRRHMIVTQLRSYPGYVPSDLPPRLIVVETVIAADYLKSFLAHLRKLVGGELRSFRVLMERARREATLRVLEKAYKTGYNAICNLRLESADVAGNAVSGGNRSRGAMVALLASATAYRAAPPTS